MMKAKIFIILFIFCVVVLVQNTKAQKQNAVLYKLKTDIETNYYSFDIKKLKIIQSTSENLVNSNLRDWHPYYYSGLLNYLLGKIYYQIDGDIAYKYFEKSVEYFDKANSMNRSAELLSLLSAGYGKMSSLSKISAIFYGLKSKLYIEEAYTMETDNPKLLLVAATHLMHTPETFGGDKQKAKNFLAKCIEINKTWKDRDTLAVRWADNPEIYAYLGQLEVLNSNKQRAKIYIDKALKYVPDYGFVLKDLMPQYYKLK